MRTRGQGIPYYLRHQVWMEKGDDLRGLGGDQINMAIDCWDLLYGYLGDPALHENMIMMADFWLDHGMSSMDLLYGNLPYPYNLKGCSGKYDGDMRGGPGYLRAMASVPELAPDDQNHLLQTTSVVQNIGHRADSITYRKFNADSEERSSSAQFPAGAIALLSKPPTWS